MKPLKTPKKIFTLFYIYPDSKSMSKWKGIAHTIPGAIVLVGNFSAMVAHLAYLLGHISTDAKGSIFAFMGASAYACVSYITLSIFILRKQITAILDKLSAIYDAREYHSTISAMHSVMTFEII